MLINIIYISDNSSNSFIFSWYIKNLLENYWYKNRKFDLIIKLIDNNKYIFKDYLLIFSYDQQCIYIDNILIKILTKNLSFTRRE